MERNPKSYEIIAIVLIIQIVAFLSGYVLGRKKMNEKTIQILATLPPIEIVRCEKP